MITLELNEKVVENYKAAETLKEFGFNDHEIQEMIDRQNDKDKVDEEVKTNEQ